MSDHEATTELGCIFAGFRVHATIDEVAVYNHALSADRVKAHYLAGSASGP